MSRRVAKSPEDMVISQRDAQRLVGEKEIADAFEGLKDGYLAAFANTKPEERERREIAYAHYKAVADVWAELQRRAQGAAVRDKREALERHNVAKCPACGVAEGELHLADCSRMAQIKANAERARRLANG